MESVQVNFYEQAEDDLLKFAVIMLAQEVCL